VEGWGNVWESLAGGGTVRRGVFRSQGSIKSLLRTLALSGIGSEGEGTSYSRVRLGGVVG